MPQQIIDRIANMGSRWVSSQEIRDMLSNTPVSELWEKYSSKFEAILNSILDYREEEVSRSAGSRRLDHEEEWVRLREMDKDYIIPVLRHIREPTLNYFLYDGLFPHHVEDIIALLEDDISVEKFEELISYHMGKDSEDTLFRLFTHYHPREVIPRLCRRIEEVAIVRPYSDNDYLFSDLIRELVNNPHFRDEKIMINEFFSRLLDKVEREDYTRHIIRLQNKLSSDN